MTTKKKVSSTLTATEVLAQAQAKESALPSTSVERPLEQENDLGNLMGSEVNDLNLEPSSEKFEEKLKSRARDNTQLLYNEIWTLPTERVEEAIVVVLPPPSTVIPREKPIPKPKPLTKWERYAKEKGIEKKKQPKKVWDDVVKEWVPRFGYKKAQAEAQKNWMMEYKEGQDEDPFEKAIEAKRERVAKNELQRSVICPSTVEQPLPCLTLNGVSFFQVKKYRKIQECKGSWCRAHSYNTSGFTDF